MTAPAGSPAYYSQMAQVAKLVSKEARRKPTEESLADASRRFLDTVFWPRIRVDEAGCWIWTGRKNGCGYGRIERDGKQIGAHRAIYAEKNGPIPDGMVVCHKCDVPACVNPAHLFLGTQKDNVQDSIQKGRHGSLHQTSKKRGRYKPQAARCPNGHLYTVGSHYITAKGVRKCRVCHRQRVARYRASAG